MLSRLARRIIFSLVFAAVVYLGLSLYADAPRLAQALLNWDWRWLPVILAVVLFNYLLRFVRWHYYLAVVQLKQVQLRPSFLIFFAGLSLTMVPGKLGDLLKSVLLKSRYDIPISYSASIVGAERLTDTMGVALLAALGLSIYPVGFPVVALIGLGMVAVVALMQSRTLADRLIGWLGRMPLVGRFAPLIRNLYTSAYLMLRLKPLVVALVLSIIAWFCECLAFFLVLLGFGLPPSSSLLLQATFIYASASLLGAVTFLPGGLGAMEASMTSLAQLLIHVGATIAAAATLLARVCTLWFAILLGGIALFVVGLPQETPRSDSTVAAD